MAGEFLSRLVALAHYQHDIAFIGLGEGLADRGPPVHLYCHGNGRVGPRSDLGQDLSRVLASRVVGREYGEVGPARGAPHQRAFGRIPVPGGAYHRDHSPVGKVLRCGNGRRHRLRGVGVVDDHGRGMIGCHPFKTSRDLGCGGEPGLDGLHREPNVDGDRSRDECVGDVEGAQQR